MFYCQKCPVFKWSDYLKTAQESVGIQMATVQDTKMHKNTKSIEAETYKLRPSLVILQYNYFVGKPLL